MIPPLAFVVAMVFMPQLVKEPYLSYRPWAAGAFAAFALILLAHVKKRLQHTHDNYDAESDTRNVHFNPDVPVDQKFMMLQQRLGCFTIMATLGYFLLAAVCIGLWVTGTYFAKP